MENEPLLTEGLEEVQISANTLGDQADDATECLGHTNGHQQNFTPRRSPRLLAKHRTDGKVRDPPVSTQVEDEVPATPKVGISFDTMLEVENFYKRYAEHQGFGVTRAQGSYSRAKERTATTWKCERWGDPQTHAIRKSKMKAKHVHIGGTCDVDDGESNKGNTKKCFCTALLYAKVYDAKKWVIRRVVLKHFNHNPSPEEAALVKGYRLKHFTKGARRKLLNDVEVGVSVSKIHSSMVRERGGYENMPLTEKDLRQVVNEERRLKMEGRDANALFAYFEKMQRENLNFFHAHRLDYDGKMKDILWVDARSQAAYEEFGDVVCFDTTYLTNEYTLPFANFVGVNHHGQSVVFGCALISNEDCDTFEWVFRQWLLYMKGKEPGGILTDQVAAMRRPLEQVMPNTCHRWCIWHILQKLPYKLRHHERYDDLKKDLLDVVYNSLSKEEFEREWTSLIHTYQLQDNEWLVILFMERCMWVPCFMTDHFWAGMRTTQRVESINSFFDQFITRHTMLCEFGERYTDALAKRAEKEKTSDAISEKFFRNRSSGFSVEKFFWNLYTLNKFKEVQRECQKVSYCTIREENAQEDGTIKCLLEDRVWVRPKDRYDEILTSRRTYYCVNYDPQSKEAVCDCRMFETHGIMCRHLVRLYETFHIDDIPGKYVLRRWRKDVVRRHSKIAVSLSDPKKISEVKLLDKMNAAFEPVTDLGVRSEKYCQIVLNGLKSIEFELLSLVDKDSEKDPSQSESNRGSSVPPLLSNTDVENNSQSAAMYSQSSVTGTLGQGSLTPTSRPSVCNIKDPPIPKKKGRPQTTRFKTACEVGFLKKGRGRGKRKLATSPDTETQSNDADVVGVPGQTTSKLKVKRSRKSVSFADVHTEYNTMQPLPQEDALLSRNSLSFG